MDGWWNDGGGLIPPPSIGKRGPKNLLFVAVPYECFFLRKLQGLYFVSGGCGGTAFLVAHADLVVVWRCSEHMDAVKYFI